MTDQQHDTEAATRPSCLLLHGAEPSLAGTPCYACGAPAFPGRMFVGAALDTPGRAGFLCTACARAKAPELAAVAESLNTLLALAPGIGAGDHGALTGALDEITQSLPAPPLAVEKGPAS